MPTWAVWTLAVALAVWCFVAMARVDDRVMDFYLRRGRNQVGRTMLWVAGTHLAWFVVWFVTGGVASIIGEAYGGPWAGFVVVPMISAYGPFVMCFLPSQYTGYRQSHLELRSRGATRAVSRAMYWTGAPFAFLGTAVSVAAFLGCFLV